MELSTMDNRGKLNKETTVCWQFYRQGAIDETPNIFWSYRKTQKDILLNNANWNNLVVIHYKGEGEPFLDI